MTRGQFFKTRVESETLIVEIRKPVGSLADKTVMQELDQVLADLRELGSRQVIIDFGQVAYFGSSLLEALRLIWNEVHLGGGRMTVCNVSPVGKEILQVAKFDHLWPIVETLNEALQGFQQES